MALSAKDATYNFGRLFDTARDEPAKLDKFGRPVGVALSVEECERPTRLAGMLNKLKGDHRDAERKHRGTQA